MNRLAKISVALLAGFMAVAPALAGDLGAHAGSALQPHSWIMALSIMALVGLGAGRSKVTEPALEEAIPDLSLIHI